MINNHEPSISIVCEPSMNPIDKALKPVWIQAPNQEPAPELNSRAVPSAEAHHRDRKKFGRMVDN